MFDFCLFGLRLYFQPCESSILPIVAGGTPQAPSQRVVEPWEISRGHVIYHTSGSFSHGCNMIRSMFTVLVRLFISVFLNLCCVVKNSPGHTSTSFSGSQRDHLDGPQAPFLLIGGVVFHVVKLATWSVTAH